MCFATKTFKTIAKINEPAVEAETTQEIYLHNFRIILFYVTERDKAFRYQLATHLSEDASLIRMEFSKRAWYTHLNKTK